MDFGIATVLAITVITYLIGQIVKATSVKNKWIPIACGIAGLALGILAFYLKMPDFPAADPITAAAVGIASGLAATGINQIYKQFTGYNAEKEIVEDNEAKYGE